MPSKVTHLNLNETDSAKMQANLREIAKNLFPSFDKLNVDIIFYCQSLADGRMLIYHDAAKPIELFSYLYNSPRIEVDGDVEVHNLTDLAPVEIIAFIKQQIMDAITVASLKINATSELRDGNLTLH